MKDIKIFVSHRIDLNSEFIDNSLYIPVRCGAVFDKREGITMLGDDTGNNISEKRKSFCEFTVQYWAWKNIDSDYYGLCHYRRYLIFANKRFKANNQKQVQEIFLENSAVRKYGLYDADYSKNVISQYDVIVNEAADVRRIWTPQGFKNTVYEHWAAHEQLFIDKRVLPMLLDMIKYKCPKYFQSAQEYLQGNMHRGYNCYVMKKVLFQDMCEFQFTIMFAMEKKLADTKIIEGFERTIGYLGEIMYGIFINYLVNQQKYKIKELQLVYFEETVIPHIKLLYLFNKILCFCKIHGERIGYFLLPKGSIRRAFVKKIYFCLIGKNTK